MPSLELKTNVALDDPKTFLLEFTEFTAKTMDKPVPAVCVSYTHVPHMAFSGTVDPAFLLTITSLWNLSPTANESFSKAFFSFFKEKLGVADSRGYIVFNDPTADFMGYQSTTVEVFRSRQ